MGSCTWKWPKAVIEHRGERLIFYQRSDPEWETCSLALRNGGNRNILNLICFGMCLFFPLSLFSLSPSSLPQLSKCWKYALPGSVPAVLLSEFRNPGYQACKAQQTALRNLAVWKFTLLLAEEKHFLFARIL